MAGFITMLTDQPGNFLSNYARLTTSGASEHQAGLFDGLHRELLWFIQVLQIHARYSILPASKLNPAQEIFLKLSAHMHTSNFSIDENGWITGISHIASPNFDVRAEGAEIQLVVVHGISLPPGSYGGGYVQQLFTNCLSPDEHEFFAEIEGLKVSAHCLIERDGKLTQFVSFNDRAWHAGVSSWQGMNNCNDFSIGIELEGTDEEAYTDFQYKQLAKLVISLRKQYPALSDEAICGHSDIAPGRKTDPGPLFDWHKLHQLIKQ
jgi:N-acetyl-anhydromuramoyl-L-alanine amidase